MVDFGSGTQRNILSLIYKTAPVTRAKLAQISGLTAPAITKITKKMLDDGLLIETGKTQSGRGQPGIQLGVNPGAAHSIGISIELESISVEVANLAGEVCFTRSVSGIFSDPEHGIAELTGLLDMLKISHPEPFETLIGVGVTTCSNFLPEGDTVKITLNHLPEWEKVDFCGAISSHLGVPVWIENDGTAAAIGEFIRTNVPGRSSLFYLYIGYGFGGGLFHDNASFRGYHGNAARLGRLFTNPMSRPSLNSLLMRLGVDDPSPHRYQALEALVESKADIFNEWLDEVSSQLNELMLTVQVMFDPQEIVLGGLLPESVLERLYQKTLAKYQQLSEPDVLLPKFSKASISGDIAAATGAAMVPFYKQVFVKE